MKNLLHAWARSICRDWLFWMEAAFMAWGGLYIAWEAVGKCRVKGTVFAWDAGAFNCVMLVGMVLPVFCSITLGREYACGAMRNKLAAGYGRAKVYFSALVVSFTAALVFAGVYLLCYMGVSLAFAPGAAMGREPGYVLALTACSLAVLFGLAAFFTMLAMLIQDRAWGVAVGLVIGFLFVMVGWYITLLLHAPEFYPLYAPGPGGTSQPTGEMARNLAYPQGAYRGLLEFVYNYTLGGMVFQCSSLDVGKPWLTILNAAATGVLATALGARVFRRLELR